MFQRILVPLDGSRLSEASLPYAVSIGHAFSAKVVLLHVVERGAASTIHGQRHFTAERDAADYLERTARELSGRGIEAEVHVHGKAVDSVTASLSEHSGELDCDLMILCAHGGSDVGRILRGSIGQRVVARAGVPVLLVRPEGAGASPGAVGRILAAVDGRPEHEQGLPVAVEIASRLRVPLRLFMAVRTKGSLTCEEGAMGRMLPGAMREMLDVLESSASQSLAERVDSIARGGVEVSSQVCRGDPAALIASSAEVGDCLIVLGTHGKAGTAAFWAGSVAPRIARLTSRPLLLVPASGR